MLGWLADSTLWGHYTAAASVIGGFAGGVGLLIGSISLLLILFQTRHSARVSNQIAALEAHKDYIRICFDHPELSSSIMMAKTLKVGSFEGILDWLTPESEKALWFLSYVLFATEQSLLSNRGDTAWRRNLEDQLAYHSGLLEVVWDDWKSHYSEQMNELIEAALDRDSPSTALDTVRPGANSSTGS